ncbi:MAG: hypothetical protein CM15mV8_2290 [Caudoviricetes sp.]|nr:MAG: hypothetical protein CM15mV8_2290 [Caudoviricetes sp.]
MQKDFVSYDATTKVLKYYQDSTDGTVKGEIIPFSDSILLI